MDVVLYLFADEDLVSHDPGHDGLALGILNGLIKVPLGARLEQAMPALTVESPRRPPRVVDNLALHPPPAPGTISTWKHVVPLFDDGVHTARWTFGDARSNHVDLRIGPGAPSPDSGHALTLEAIPSIGVALESHLFARLRNLTGAPIDRPSTFIDCAAIIDGVRSRYKLDAYHGSAELAPGESLWQLFSLDRFDPRPAPGDHEVVLEMGGQRSLAVHVRR